MLVSARLLVGPRLGEVAPTAARASAALARDRRRLAANAVAVALQRRGIASTKRACEETFFTRSHDHGAAHRSTNMLMSAGKGLSMVSKLSRAGGNTSANTSIMPVYDNIFVRHWKQKHMAASAAPSYAPLSDDPAITSLGGTRSHGVDEVDNDTAGRTALTPEQAVAAGYRNIDAPTLATLPRLYRQLAKAQLTFLVTLTGMAGYALCPSSLAISTSVTTLLLMTGGTALCSASANAINQLVESPYDAQMPRTRNRPLPSRSLTPLHAATFAATSGTLGVTALAGINPLTAALGLANIVLYAGVYTPTKRATIANTWVGSVVGGIPPLIGWTACTGTLHLASDLPGWSLAALMFAWQFPHFNSLAHTLRREYARGGYRMMSVTDPALNRRTSLRYAISLLPICSVLLPWTGVVHWSYAVLSAPINAALVWASYGFWRHDGDKPARLCFWVSLLHLPAVLLLAMALKTDVVEGLQKRLGWIEEGTEERATS